MVIGIDFDNTIVCYDDVFRRAALELKLIPDSFSGGKRQIRDHLRGGDREPEWTRLQGHVYGVSIADAQPFPGILEALRTLRQRRIGVYIVSHRTRRPLLGDAHDLHLAADAWLETHGFYEAPLTGLSRERVFFEPTVRSKLRRIHSTACTHFVDDLPEFLLDPEFPAGVDRILFDPAGTERTPRGLCRAASWAEVSALLHPAAPASS